MSKDAEGIEGIKVSQNHERGSSSTVINSSSGGGRDNAHLAVLHDKLAAQYDAAEEHHKR